MKKRNAKLLHLINKKIHIPKIKTKIKIKSYRCILIYNKFLLKKLQQTYNNKVISNYSNNNKFSLMKINKKLI